MSDLNINVTSTPAPASTPAAEPARHASLNTRRGLAKYILLGLITFGIYDLWQMSEITDTVNLICTKRDGKRTMHYLLMFFLVGWITFGIGWFVWGHRLSARIGVEQAAADCPSP